MTTDADQVAHLEMLRGDVGVSIEQADRGELLDGHEVFDELLKPRKPRHVGRR